MNEMVAPKIIIEKWYITGIQVCIGRY